MICYLDVEFTNFHGDLISFALVPEDHSVRPLYVVLASDQYAEPSDWVKKNVVPHLGLPDDSPSAIVHQDVTRELAALVVSVYLRQFDHVEVVADWPEDFALFMMLLLTGPGSMVSVPDFDMHYRALRGFTTADVSLIPHNALFDAIALRDHCAAS